jgi:hypothetical protein
MIQRQVKNLSKSPSEGRLKSDFNSPLRMNRSQSQNRIVPSEEEEIENFTLTTKKIHSNKQKLDDINSDLDNMSGKDEISDCTSMTESRQSEFSAEEGNHSSRFRPGMTNDRKMMYMEFAKIVLKIKFEKLNNSHSGMNIDERLIFKECLKRKIPNENWPDFIYAELQQPNKYSKPKRESKYRVKTYIA